MNTGHPELTHQEHFLSLPQITRPQLVEIDTARDANTVIISAIPSYSMLTNMALFIDKCFHLSSKKIKDNQRYVLELGYRELNFR